MELLNNSEFSLEQWVQLFILAMAVISVSSLATMFSVWILNAKLTDIRDLLKEQSKTAPKHNDNEADKPPMLDQ